MNALESWYSAAELLGLPGLFESRSALLDKAKRENWQSRPRQGRGGGQEYHFSSLPEATQQHLINAATPDNLPIPAPPEQPLATVDPKPVTQLKRYQRDTMVARLALLNELDRMTAVLGRGQAVNVLCEMVAAGSLSDELQALVPQALGKGKRRLKISRATLYRWLDARDRGEVELAPQAPQSHPLPVWGPAFLELYQRWQKPPVPWALRQMAKVLPPEQMPSQDQAYRLLKKMGALERLKGRVLPRKLKDISPYRVRDTGNMWPTDVYSMDGHAFDAEIQHPRHGRAFRPEMTTVIDIVTRRVVGWSVALAESSWAVLDALRHACCTGGIPANLYVDNGSGYRNALIQGEGIGLMARLSTNIDHSRPYNSRARGAIERLNATLWVDAARGLDTYIGADADPQAKQAIHRLTRKQIKETGRSSILPSWPHFLRYCEECVSEYNHRPHSTLPMTVDPSTGKRRHQTPMEAWEAALSEGFTLTEVDAELDADLFRPYEFKKVDRGQVRLWGNTYYNGDLKEWHGERVKVGYDIHDAQHVWVHDRNDRLLCIAEFEANKTDYYPVTKLEETRLQRERARLARLDRKREEIELEGGSDRPALVEAEPLTDEQRQLAAELRSRIIPAEAETPEPIRLETPAPAEQATTDRPIFNDDTSFYRWAKAQPTLSAGDAAYLAELEADGAFMTLWRLKESRGKAEQ